MHYPNDLSSPKLIALAAHNAMRSQLRSVYTAAASDAAKLEALVQITPEQVPPINLDLTLQPAQFSGSFPLDQIKTYKAVFVAASPAAARSSGQKPLMVICTYSITSKVTNETYVGSTEDFYGRWYKHLRELRNREHKNDRLQALFDRDGENNLCISIIRSYESTDGLVDAEVAAGCRVSADRLINYRLGYRMVGNWMPVHHHGRRTYTPATRRGKNSVPRWFDGQGEAA